MSDPFSYLDFFNHRAAQHIHCKKNAKSIINWNGNQIKQRGILSLLLMGIVVLNFITFSYSQTMDSMPDRAGDTFLLSIKDAINTAYEDQPAVQILNLEISREYIELQNFTQDRSPQATLLTSKVNLAVMELEYEKQIFYDQLKTQVVERYYDLLLARSFIPVLEKKLYYTKHELEKAQTNYEQGLTDTSTLRLREAEVALFQEELNQASARKERCITSLLILLNKELNSNIRLLDSLDERSVPLDIQERYLSSPTGGVPEIISIAPFHEEIIFNEDLNDSLENHRDIIIAEERIHVKENEIQVLEETNSHSRLIEAARIELDRLKLELEAAKQQVANRLWDYYIIIQDKLAAFRSAKIKVQLAEANYQFNYDKYQQGFVREVHLNESEVQWREAQYFVQETAKEYSLAFIDYDLERTHHSLFYPAN